MVVSRNFIIFALPNLKLKDIMATKEPIINFNSLTPEQQNKLKEMTTDVCGLEKLTGEFLSFKEYHVLKTALREIFGKY